METLPKVDVKQLQPYLAKGQTVLMFTADWCPDCQFIKPAMPEIEKDFADFKFYSVDRDENIDLAAELGIMGIPSFVAYRDGEEIGRFVNKDRKTKQQVEAFLNGLN